MTTEVLDIRQLVQSPAKVLSLSEALLLFNEEVKLVTRFFCE
jgi:hypothetical protein